MLDFTRFQLLSFDCYGTLIDWETGIFSALRPILATHGKNVSDRVLLETYAELEAQAERGEFRNYRDVLQSVVQGFGERLGFKPTAQEIHSLPESVAQWRPFSDTVAALRKLKRFLSNQSFSSITRRIVLLNLAGLVALAALESLRRLAGLREMQMVAAL